MNETISIASGQENPAPRPPIMSRMATFFADLPEETFEQGQPDWERLIADVLPDSHREPRWKFEIAEYEKGLPRLKDTRPSMWIDLWHQKTLPDKRGVNTARIFPNEGKGRGGISFATDRSSSQHPRSYTQLRSFFTEVLPGFKDAFAIKKFTAVDLFYHNLIRSDLYPEFSSDEINLSLGKVLETHRNLNLPGYGFLLPYEHKMVCRASPDRPMIALVDIRVAEPYRDVKGKSDGCVNLMVDLTVRLVSQSDSEHLTVDQAFVAMDDCHEKVLEFFKGTFTATAQRTFHAENGEVPADQI